ncbi:MAG: flagellar FlbD family protein [Gaiellales bacterium]
MIELHRIHGTNAFYVNPDLIEVMESCPDTVITLVNKHRYVIAEPVSEVVDKIIAFRARVAAAAGTQGDYAAGARAIPVSEMHDREQAA